MKAPSSFAAVPLETQVTVEPGWIDYNGHMNVAYYVLAFDRATDRMLDLLDVGEAYRRRTEASFFVLESHITYDREVVADDPCESPLKSSAATPSDCTFFITCIMPTRVTWPPPPS